jgi:hypothetical protein
MVHAAVDFEEMRSKLLTVEDVRARLAATEPLSEHVFTTGSGVTFEVGQDWATMGDQSAPAAGMEAPVNAFLVTPGGTRYQLTRGALLEAGAEPGMPRKLAERMSPAIFAEFLNYEFGPNRKEREIKVLAHERPDAAPLALATCRGTIQPFSNLALLDRAVSGIRNAYGSGAEILVDYKFYHDLERTNIRLIVPGASRVITGTRVADDTWCAGLDIANSLTGKSHPGTAIRGNLFRWWCTNGCTDTLAGGGSLSRRNITDPAEAYAWAEQAVNEVLGSLEHSFDAVQELTGIPVGESGVPIHQLLSELYAQHAIPQAAQRRITAELMELGGDLTAYDLQQAITRAANAQDATPREVGSLLRLGGDVMHVGAHARCDVCHSVLPEGFVPGASAGGNAN